MVKLVAQALLISFLVCLAVVAEAQPAGLHEHNAIQAAIENSPNPRIIIPADDSSPPDLSANTKAAEYVPNEIIVKFKTSLTDTLETQLGKGLPPDKLKLSASLDRLNNKYRLSSANAIFKNFRKNRQHIKALREKNKTLLTRAERRILRRLARAPKNIQVPELGGIYKIKVAPGPGESLEEIAAAYANDPQVEYAELNYIVSTFREPNDPNYPVQWALNNTGQMYPESGRYRHPPGTEDCDIDAPEAWDIYTGDQETIVAVVDTGVDYNHRDLAGNVWVNELELNGIVNVDDDKNGYVDDVYGYDFLNRDGDPKDDHGHGTHCSGIIAAKGNNELDITGVCWDAKIMSLKFLGPGGLGDITDAVEAFYYAVENGAEVISNSWGGGGYLESTQEAIDYAHSQGVILVAAAGNDNSDVPFYPANYARMISVAATDSNDDRAPFSTYGNWVDLAAPGVDILSLRAQGTSMGTTYDGYKTVASGTSMACPLVAGLCAMLISVNPILSYDDINDIIRQTSDTIAPGICASNGRVNIFNALLASTTPEGQIKLERDYYTCSGLVSIHLADSDLDSNSTQEVTVTTSDGDLETVVLEQTIPGMGIFTGSISTVPGEPNIEDGTLQLSHDLTIYATYEDANDGTGNTATATDTAIIDCEEPSIFNIQLDIPGPEPIVSFETNEPALTKILCGLSCTDPNAFVRRNPVLATSHVIKLRGVSLETEYFFKIYATDIAGNETIDTNDGWCYVFTTNGPGDINVPTQFTTLQEAIDRSWDTGRVLIADGIYSGPGNRDINFNGKSITVQSQNGPENCIIDCNGTEQQPHRGFKFASGEGPSSVLAGITITNGYGPEEPVVYFMSPAGNAVFCDNSSPTIANCRFEGNNGGRGAIFCLYFSSPSISNCTITDNSTDYVGAGIYCGWLSHPTISDCLFTGNSAEYGGGIFCWLSSNPAISHCTFAGNQAKYYGGTILCNGASPNLSNCTITGNRTTEAGGATYYRSSMKPVISNCILWDNYAADGPELFLVSSGSSTSNLTVSFSDIKGGQIQASFDANSSVLWGPGNIETDPCFVTAGYWDNNSTPEDMNDDTWVNGEYHLQSQAGRWEPNQGRWITDISTSLCIDAGNPGCTVIGEFEEPNNTRINMGAYGGTTEASKAPAGWSLLADLTNDGTGDFQDLTYIAGDWQETASQEPGDLNRDGAVNWPDVALFVDDWLRQTIWYE